jgi:hypothetical protein
MIAGDLTAARCWDCRLSRKKFTVGTPKGVYNGTKSRAKIRLWVVGL